MVVAIDSPLLIPHSDARLLLTTDAIDDHVDFAALLAEVLPGLTEAKDPAALALPSAPDLRAVVLFGTRRRDGFLPLDDLVALGRDVPDEAVHAASEKAVEKQM